MTASDPGPPPSGHPAAATRTAWLIAHGRHPWAEISALLTGCTCAWADLDGFHAGPPPAGPPLATHLWAWEPGRLLRARVDGSDGIAAELHFTYPGHGEPVRVTEREAASWPPGEGRVSVDDKWRGRTIRVCEVTGLMPLEFARLNDAAPADQTGEDT
jgi:hypothetical protein